jgi:hypothetical protein
VGCLHSTRRWAGLRVDTRRRLRTLLRFNAQQPEPWPRGFSSCAHSQARNHPTPRKESTTHMRTTCNSACITRLWLLNAGQCNHTSWFGVMRGKTLFLVLQHQSSGQIKHDWRMLEATECLPSTSSPASTSTAAVRPRGGGLVCAPPPAGFVILRM